MKFITSPLLATAFLSAVVAATSGEDQLKSPIAPRVDDGPNLAYNGGEVSCDGSSLCSTHQDLVVNCDVAKGFLVDDKQYNTAHGGEGSGVCERNCGIFVKGDGCRLSGKDMKTGYDDIRNNGCKKCGKVSLPDTDCTVKTKTSTIR